MTRIVPLLAMLTGVACEATETALAECEINPELLSESKTCSSSTECPCGSRCEFGRCISDCATCASGVSGCSPFGRCAEADALSIPDPGSVNFFTLSHNSVRLKDDQERTTVIVRRGNATDNLELEVRVEHSNFAVDCGELGATVGRSCRLVLGPDTGSGEVTVVNLAAQTEFDPNRTEEDVFEPALFVSSMYETQSIPIVVAAEEQGQQRIVNGVYTGTAKLSRVRGVQAAGEPVSPVELPLRLVFSPTNGGDDATSWVVAVDDSAGVFGDAMGNSAVRAGQLNYAPTADAADEDYRFEPEAPRVFIEGSVGSSAYQIGSAVTDLRQIKVEGDRVRLQLYQRYQIATSRDPALQAIWTVNLARVLPEDPGGELPVVVDSNRRWLGVDPNAQTDLELAVLGPDAPFFQILQSAGGDVERVQELVCGDGAVPGVPTSATEFSTELAMQEVVGVSTDIATPFYDGEVACRYLGDGTNDAGEAHSGRWPLYPILLDAGLNPANYKRYLADCMDELEAGDAYSNASGAYCVETARVFAAANVGLEGARQDVADPDIQAQRLALYLLARYLDVHGFVSHLYGLEEDVDRFIDDPSALPLENLPTMVERTIKHLDMVLHPRLLAGVASATVSVELDPDYRVGIVGREVLDNADLLDDIHSVPYSLSLASDAVDQSELWVDLASKYRNQQLTNEFRESSRRSLAASVRRGFFLYVFSTYLFQNAEDVRELRRERDPDSPNAQYIWQGDWAVTSNRLAAALTEIADSLDAAPAQPEQLSLPWNRIGDQEGAIARFQAMSEVMLGTEPALGGVVGYELGLADQLRELAQVSYVNYRQEVITFQRINNRIEDWLDYAANKIGSRLVKLCGFNDGTDPLTGYEIFDQTENIQGCFVDPNCIVATDEPPENSPRRDPRVAFRRLCRLAHVSQNAIDDAQLPSWLRSMPRVDPVSATETDLAGWLISGVNITYDPSTFFFSLIPSPGAAPQSFTLEQLQDEELGLRFRGEANSLFTAAELFCDDAYRRAFADSNPASCAPQLRTDEDGNIIAPAGAGDSPVVPMSCKLDIDAASETDEYAPDCYRGELGVAFRKLLAAEDAMKVPQANLERLLTRFSVKEEQCRILSQTRDAISDQYTNYINSVKEMRSGLLRAERDRAVVAGIADCVSGSGLSSAFKATQTIKTFGIKGKGQVRIQGAKSTIRSATSGEVARNVLTGASQCGGAITQQIAAVEKRDAEIQIDNLKDEFSKNKELLERDTEISLCYNSLNSIVAEMDPAYAAIRTAEASVLSAATQFDQLQRRSMRMFEEGRIWRANLLKRRITSIPQNYEYQVYFGLLQDSVERLQSALLYAARAVQYEMQQSVMSRDEILGAERIEDLRRIAFLLKDVVLSGRVQGSTPSEGRIVLSLKRDILRLPAEGTAPEGYHDLDDNLRLRQALLSPEHAVFEASGRYIGQSIPFALSPFALGDISLGADVTGGLLCGERIWSVGAVAVGRDAVGFEDSRLVPLFLRKYNQFFSRACGLEDAQVEGFIGDETDVFDFGSSGAPDEFTSAWLNTTVLRSDSVGTIRAGVESGTQPVNLTQEFAALGLYGSYQLILSQEALGQLALEELQDVLFVFDVVAATNNARF